jgi:tRNA threonylcarbamoyladenosine biosynthesis protein TsaE
MEVCVHSAERTAELGARLADLLVPGDVVILSGDLGSGKTVFAQGVGRGLGVEERVVSPTFTIAREYEGRLPLQHLDVYRLDHVQEASDLGLAELPDDHAVTLVEWGERVSALLPPERLEVRLAQVPPEEADDDTRVVSLLLVGASWLERSDAISAVVASIREQT